MKKLLTILLLLLACMAIFCACGEGSTEPPAAQTPNAGEASGGDPTLPHTHTWSGNAVCTSCGYESKLEYTEYDTYAEVTGIGTESGVVQVSNVYNGKPVTSIGDSAFSYCKALTSITIPLSVTSIGQMAFYNCTGLTEVIFENTEGWWRSTSSTATSGTSVDVSNPGDNADLLTDTYRFYYWKRG